MFWTVPSGTSALRARYVADSSLELLRIHSKILARLAREQAARPLYELVVFDRSGGVASGVSLLREAVCDFEIPGSVESVRLYSAGMGGRGP